MSRETGSKQMKRKKMGLSERRLTEEGSFELIMKILESAGKPLTTRDVEGEIRKTLTSCPDTLPVLLNRLRMKGLVEGKLSAEHRGWIWWIETGS